MNGNNLFILIPKMEYVFDSFTDNHSESLYFALSGSMLMCVCVYSGVGVSHLTAANEIRAISYPYKMFTRQAHPLHISASPLPNKPYINISFEVHCHNCWRVQFSPWSIFITIVIQTGCCTIDGHLVHGKAHTHTHSTCTQKRLLAYTIHLNSLVRDTYSRVRKNTGYFTGF